MDWNPKLYMKYGNERTQPSIDLVSRIALDYPKSIIDIGCGPGNSTQILVKRWPKSEIAGLDNSPNMIEKAGKDFPKQGGCLPTPPILIFPENMILYFPMPQFNGYLIMKNFYQDYFL